MEIVVYSQDGKVVEKMPLNKDIFEVAIKEDLIQKLLLMQLSNARSNIAHTKTRGEVRGSTIKLRRQKGSGKGRVGSARSPSRVGGGVAFGPRNERNFVKNLTKKERRTALFSLLSLKAKDGQVLGLKEYKSDMNTKKFLSMLDKLPVEKKVLVVLSERNEIIEKSSNNIPFVKTILVNYLNPKDLLKYTNLIFFKDSLSKLESIFLKK